MILTKEELQIVIPLLDAGIKASGLQVFQNDGGMRLQSALAKLQQMANDDHAEAVPKPNGHAAGDDEPRAFTPKTGPGRGPE